MPGCPFRAARNPSSRRVCCRALRRSAAARRALAVQQLGHVLAGQPAAGVVVGGDEADVVVALQTRVEDDDGDAALHRGRDRADERRLVERRERDPGDAARHRVLDFGDLRVAVVLAQRAPPHDSRRSVPAPPSPRRRAPSARTGAWCPSESSPPSGVLVLPRSGDCRRRRAAGQGSRWTGLFFSYGPRRQGLFQPMRSGWRRLPPGIRRSPA